MAAQQNHRTQQQQLTALSSIRNADDERLDHLCCKIEGLWMLWCGLNPLNSLLTEKKVNMLYVRWRMQRTSIYHWTQLVVMWNNARRCNTSTVSLKQTCYILCSYLVMKLEASRPCATSGNVRHLIAHRVCTQERRNTSQRIARGLQNLLWTTQSCCPFTAAENAVKVCTFVLNAYIHHWHLRTCIYLMHICIISN